VQPAQSQAASPSRGIAAGAIFGGARAFGVAIVIAGVLFIVALAVAKNQEGWDGIGTFLLALYGLPVLIVIAVVVGAVRGALTRGRPVAVGEYEAREELRNRYGAGYPAAAIGALFGSVLSFPALIFMVYIFDFAAPQNEFLPAVVGSALLAGLAAAGANYMLKRNQHDRARETSLLLVTLLAVVYLAFSYNGQGSQPYGALLKPAFFSAPVLAGIACRWLTLRVLDNPHTAEAG
jgi:peptidoglycan/LPS O-acetylase OafA/YrhL